MCDTNVSPATVQRIWSRDITDKAIRRGVFASVADLVTVIEDYLRLDKRQPPRS